MMDFHCHLDLYPDPDHVVRECVARRTYVLSVTTTPSAFTGTKALGESSKRIRTALGLHPEIAHQRLNELKMFDNLIEEADYVGEVGLDGKSDGGAFWREQVKVFGHILKASAEAGGRKMTVHSREAATPVLDMIGRHMDPEAAILHWFSGSDEELRRAVDMGCWFSVGPAMTLTKRGKLRCSIIPEDRVLLETDGPFASVGSKPLFPWEAFQSVDHLASVWNRTPLDSEKRLRDNLVKFAGQ